MLAPKFIEGSLYLLESLPDCSCGTEWIFSATPKKQVVFCWNKFSERIDECFEASKILIRKASGRSLKQYISFAQYHFYINFLRSANSYPP